MEFQIGSDHLSAALIVAVIVAVLCVISLWRRQRQIRSFANIQTWSRLYRGHSSARRALHGFIVCCGFGLLAVALLDIRYGRQQQETPQQGIEVIFALDVSRSMLAQDTTPNRLERAKQQIRDLVREMPGDRVGLVLFAGDAKQVVPLTRHREDFYHSLDSADPYALRKGGSQLGVAIRVARQSFIDKTADHRAIIVFTDGEDQASKPIKEAQRARDEDGIRIFTVGLGDHTQGARIPVGDRRSDPAPGFVQHLGETVWSKMNGKILEQVATVTDGAYIPAGTKRVDMSAVYARYISRIPKSEFTTAEINAFIPRFQWFAIPALICFVAELWLVTSRRQLRKPMTAGVILLAGCLMSSNVSAATQSTAKQLVEEAQERIAAGDPNAALELYQLIPETPQNRAPLAFNRGVAQFQAGAITEAIRSFQAAAGTSDDQLAAKAYYNLGNCTLTMAQQQADEEFENKQRLLKQAVQYYRRALHLDNDYDDARVNLELTVRLLQELQEKPPQQQSPSESSDQQEQPQGSDDESAEDDSKDRESADSQSSPSESESSRESDTEDSSENSQGESQEDSSDASDADPNSSDADSGEASQQSAADEEREADPNESEDRSGDAENSNDSSKSESQESTSGEATSPEASRDDISDSSSTSQRSNSETRDGESENDAPASFQADDLQTQDQEPPRGQLTSEPQAGGNGPQSGNQALTPGIMTKEEAQKLLQAVRDRAMLRRLLKQQRERERRIPVSRDW